MAACPSCGRENPDDARFCNACGATLVPEEGTREQRKVVTVLFCDLVGSTALGESTDPEALRARMRRYFEDLRAIVERHGGTVEKFVGDAVMAVFGIPVAHEDDALRAVRAAWEMRDAIAAHGLEARIGVNTGEVVVGGDAETLVTGDAVNVAARLEQTAPPGTVVIGPVTRLLVRDAVRVERTESLVLKGKSAPVDAYRLVDVVPGAEPLARHLETPLVGRDRERQRLLRDYEDAVADRTCRLFTLLGPAGIGKSRLVADFLERVGHSADVLRGRCLHYGEGITYWPLVEILLTLGVDVESVIGTSPAETQLAFRRLLEERASERPQVAVLDDLQWAEPTFLDLLEHVADLSRGVPIFLLCIARNELLDGRPGWGGGKVNATALLLEPLHEEECAVLIQELGGGAELDPALRERITAASGGNPLFVEEMLAMVREHGGNGEVVVPPTIHALLQARIDSLDREVRAVMERGAVEGEVFHRGAVAELAPEPVRAQVETHLATLVRKELIRSTKPTFPQDEGFRFRHLLIRDAAYESLPKATRAELHERFADWLSRQDLVERDEIVGYHLEQAHRYRAELDADDPRLAELATQAAERLGSAGQGAMSRGDWGAARILLRRARALLPLGDPRRAHVALELAYALQETGELEEAKDAIDDVLSASDPVVRARGIVADVETRALSEDMRPTESTSARREEARAVLEAAGDDAGLARYWKSLGWEAWAACQADLALERWERGARHAERVGAEGLVYELLSGALGCLVLGPIPAAAAAERAEAIRERARGSALLEASALQALGMLVAMQGQVDEGRELLRSGWHTTRDAGHWVTAASSAQRFAFVETRAGDVVAEEAALREGLAELERLDDRAFLSTVALDLAACLGRQGRFDEVRELSALARERTLSGDVVNDVYLAATEAQLAASEGHAEEAERLGRESVEVADTTDFFAVRGSRSRAVLAPILGRRGKVDEAQDVAAEAIAVHEAKGDVAGVAVIRSQLESAGFDVA